MYIALAILAFGIIIAIHELGHFLSAKALNVKVNEFAIGMGPKLLKKQGKETLYTLRALPFGGFCAMEGEHEEGEEPDPRSFLSQKRWKRIVILAAGSAANIIAALIIMLILNAGAPGFVGTTIAETDSALPGSEMSQLRPGDRLIELNGERLFYNDDIALFMQLHTQFNANRPVALTIDRGGERIEMIVDSELLTGRSTTIAQVFDHFPQLGPSQLQAGDRIVAINGEYPRTYNEYRRMVAENADGPITFTLDRNGETVEYQRQAVLVDGEEHFRYSIVFKPIVSFNTISPTIFEVIKYSGYQTYSFVRMIRVSLVMMFSGTASIQDISGPVGIVSVMNTIGQQAPTTTAAIGSIVFFMAFIGVNVAVINILPIPAMDGGRILFVLLTWVIEKLTRKHLNPKYEGYINTGAFILLIGLMVLILYNDVMKLINGVDILGG